MSRHHRSSKHTTHSPEVRKAIASRLPLPCLEGCGRLVLATDSWHVAHRVPASKGGRTTIANCGPAHATCNLRSGGRMGAAVTNVRRRAAQDIRPW